MHTKSSSLFLLGLGLLSFACGGDDGGTVPGPNGGTGSTSGTGTGGADSGGGNTSSGGSAAPGNVTIPTTVPSETCGAKQYTYRGSVGGVPVDESLTLPGLAVHSNAYLSAEVLEFTSGAPFYPTAGALRFPDESAHAGKIWCIDEGSLFGDDSYSFVGHLLGTCAGTPVAGEIQVCEEENTTDCAQVGEKWNFLRGMIGDKDAGSGSAEAITMSTASWTISTSDYELYLAADEAIGVSGSVSVTGFMVGTTIGADPGAVYCIGGGTWERTSDSVDSATLTDITLVGNCRDAGAAENLEGCHSY